MKDLSLPNLAKRADGLAYEQTETGHKGNSPKKFPKQKESMRHGEGGFLRRPFRLYPFFGGEKNKKGKGEEANHGEEGGEEGGGVGGNLDVHGSQNVLCKPPWGKRDLGEGQGPQARKDTGANFTMGPKCRRRHWVPDLGKRSWK